MLRTVLQFITNRTPMVVVGGALSTHLCSKLRWAGSVCKVFLLILCLCGKLSASGHADMMRTPWMPWTQKFHQVTHLNCHTEQHRESQSTGEELLLRYTLRKTGKQRYGRGKPPHTCLVWGFWWSSEIGAMSSTLMIISRSSKCFSRYIVGWPA